MEIRFPEDATERTGALRLWTGAYYSLGYVSDLQPRPLAATAEVLVAVHDGAVIGTASIVPGFREPLSTLKYFGLIQLDERHRPCRGMSRTVGTRAAAGAGVRLKKPWCAEGSL